jgi:hypothetical protein
MVDHRRVQLLVTVDDDLDVELERAAAREQRSVSAYVEAVLRRALDADAPTAQSADQPDDAPRPWPTSIGSGDNPNFDARDTDEYLRAHWIHDIQGR